MIEKLSFGSSLAHQFQYTQQRLAQRAWEDQWAKFEHVRMLLANSTVVARQVKIPNRSKPSTRKTACLDLTRGHQPLHGTGKHVVKSDMAQPVQYTLGTSKFSYVHM
jgi:hypothetical protein